MNAMPSGSTIKARLEDILARCKKAGERIGYPGEGGERRFRYWLATDFLTPLFGWPAEQVVIGERFDVLLVDRLNFPLQTIETKTPYHRASKAERKSFEDRLSGFGTLRYAYFTNGAEWERLSLSFDEGEAQFHDAGRIDIAKAVISNLEAFFRPLLLADEPDIASAGKLRVESENPHVAESLSSHLTHIVDSVSHVLEERWYDFHRGNGGDEVKEITDNLLELWCERSLIVPPEAAAREIAAAFKKQAFSGHELITFLRELGFPQTDAVRVAAGLGNRPLAQRRDVKIVKELVFPTYSVSITKMCVQTAHVVLARALAYRVGEDQRAFSKQLVGNPLARSLKVDRGKIGTSQTPATAILDTVQGQMRTLLPTVYELGEFDWWQVPREKRAVLPPARQSLLAARDDALELSLREMLLILNGYDFSAVNLDVWRNVYQHYLPAEERQRLGGFYTPDELISLMLDELGYQADEPNLCSLTYLDPASGSGAFVAAALARLLAHLDKAMACHGHISTRLPKWKAAEEKLKIVSSCVHGVDIHPFAAFLTTINALFQLMPLYAAAREKDPEFAIQLDIFASDSLDKHETDTRAPGLFDKINARVRLTENASERYKKLLQRRFDRVFGNPPWGGVLKGPLAPVYDDSRKKKFAAEYPNSARGKYDIYALFVERVIELLSAKGRAVLLTPDSFLGKEWAATLRKYLVSDANIHAIISLNPFGNLFFKAMNTPAIVRFDGAEGRAVKDVEAVMSKPVHFERSQRDNERREYVVTSIAETLKLLRKRKAPVEHDFASAGLLPVGRLRETASRGWDLSARAPLRITAKTVSAAVLFEPSQGVTPGGEGCMDIFVLDQKQTREVDKSLVHPMVKGLDITRWRALIGDRQMLYPYREVLGTPAFQISLAEVDKDLRGKIQRSGLEDALDFSKALDANERTMLSKGDYISVVNYRKSLGLLKNLQTALYLVSQYEKLEQRIFKKKNIRSFGREWYEFIWPRATDKILSPGKILTPRLTREVRFALDDIGLIPQDSCIFMVPRADFGPFRERLGRTMGKKASQKETLAYCLAFLNSDVAQRALTSQPPTPKGSYAISEKIIADIPIAEPVSADACSKIISLAVRLNAGKSSAVETDERALAALVTDALGSSAPVVSKRSKTRLSA